MKKKAVVLIGICTTVALLSVFLFRYMESKLTSEALEMIDRVEIAVKELDEGWEKQSVTQAVPLSYADGNGNTILFYQCHTKYDVGDPAEVSGLHIGAIETVVEVPEEYRACTVSDFSAAWFEVGDRAYLCWTISPEISCILEYSPDAVDEADIFRMAESVR